MASSGSGSVWLAGLELTHPVLNASGTFDFVAAVRAFGDSVIEDFPFSCYVTKTITIEPRAGNPPPRLWETAAGMINSIGLPNRGLEGFISADLPRLAELSVPLMVSVAGFSTDEFKLLVRALGENPDIDALELNISCPNVKSGCVFGVDEGETETLLAGLRGLTNKPLVVKLTPTAADIAAVGLAAERGGADALSLINTLPATAVDPKAGKVALGAGSGGLSGPCIKPVALQMVRVVSAHAAIPVVGMGGISNGQDALDFLRVGASLVAVGTESFRDPMAGKRVRDELAQIL